MLTVVCLWIQGKGKRAYGLEYVEKLRSMVDRHLSIPHGWACLTDTPERVPEGMQAIRVKRPTYLRPWWLKVKLFSPKMPFEGRMLYLDLDVVVLGGLDEIAAWPAEFAILPDMASRFKGKKGAPPPVHGYNSSVMVWDAGARSEIWTDWDSSIADRVWGDQCWIKTRFPNEAMFPREWFTRLHRQTAPPFPSELKVILCIKLKNVAARRKLPWFDEYWQ